MSGGCVDEPVCTGQLLTLSFVETCLAPSSSVDLMVPLLVSVLNIRKITLVSGAAVNAGEANADNSLAQPGTVKSPVSRSCRRGLLRTAVDC